MIRKFALSLGIFIAMAGAARAEYVDTIGGGHGPFPCSGPIPGYGYAEVSNGVECQRWRGDFDGGSQHQGIAISPTIRWNAVHFSPQFTAGTVCYDYPTGPSEAPCSGQFAAPVYGSSGHDLSSRDFTYQPVVLLLRYDAYCPVYPGMVTLHLCTGTATPEDGSGYASAVITNGIPTPGLPLGQPLYLPNPYSLADDCKATLSDYGLSWAPPPGYPYGQTVAAAYGCP